MTDPYRDKARANLAKALDKGRPPERGISIPVAEVKVGDTLFWGMTGRKVASIRPVFTFEDGTKTIEIHPDSALGVMEFVED